MTQTGAYLVNIQGVSKYMCPQFGGLEYQNKEKVFNKRFGRFVPFPKNNNFIH